MQSEEVEEVSEREVSEIELRVNSKAETKPDNVISMHTPNTPKTPIQKALYGASKQLKWGCFQYLLVFTSFFAPLLLTSLWFLSLAIVKKSPTVTTISGTIGTPGYVYIMNVIASLIICLIMGWITFLRNIQIRVIFDRFPEYNIQHENDNNNIEYTDYVCKCCYHCNRDRCGGPIYHNKHEHGHTVNNCKFYCTTIRGFNFIATIINICSWIGLITAYIFDIYKWPKTHFITVGITVAGIIFYQFTHAAILCRQRKSEFNLINENERNCKKMHYFIDVIFSMFVPIYVTMMYLTHIASASYLQRAMAGGTDAPENTNYMFQWMSLPGLVIYYMSFSVLFYKDNVQDELEQYSAFRCGYCFC